jgi:signal transduction histidine kinase
VSSKGRILLSGAIARLENLAHPVSHPPSQNSTLRHFALLPKVHNPKPPYPYVEITVSDTGIGISKEFLPFLFDRLEPS